MSDEIIKVIKLRGEVVEGKTLKDLKEQAGKEPFDKLVLTIATIGGSVKEGLQIMIWMDELSQSGVEVVSVVEANAYSIGSMIMLAADVKLISKHGEVMVHNPMLPELKYVNANELEQHLAKLRELESAMYGIYQMLTGQDEETIKGLMDKETYMTPQQAVEFGFADMVVDMLPKPYDEPSEAENVIININMIKHINSLKKVIKMVNGDAFVNLTYNTKGGSKIEIYQEDSSTYKVGDKTDLEEGTVQLGDGSTLVIKDYKIEDIKKEAEAPKVENSNVGEPPAEEKKEAINKADEAVKDGEDVKNAEITRVSSWQSSVENESFNIGDEVKYSPTEFDPEPSSVGVGEWKLDDGRRFLTDSEGVIRMFLEDEAPKPAPEAEPAETAKEEKEEDKNKEVIEAIEDEEDKPKVETPAEEDKPKAEENGEEGKPKEEEPIAEGDKDKELEEANKKIEEMEAKFKSLEEKIAKMEDESKENEEFMDKTAEAITAIAKQTSSSFSKDAAKVVNEVEPEIVGSSIFKRALHRSKQAKITKK